MSADDSGPGELASAVRRVIPSVRASLDRLVRIPSVSADPAAAPHLEASAREVAAQLRQAGLPNVDVVTVPGGQPAVLGWRPGPPGAPTVLLYAHHDVQPAGDRAAWDSDPFQPQERGGRLYGRGAADDKAGIAVHLAALRAHGGRLPVGVTVFVEGEEEIGSPAISRLLAAHRDRLRADVVVLADSANWTTDVPALTTSLRGGVNVTVEVATLRHGVHSGLYGGPVPDALTSLCRLLATLHDERGDVAVAGLARGAAAAPGLAPPGLAAPGLAAPGLAAPGLAAPGLAAPGLAAPGLAAPELTEELLRAEAGVLDGVRLTGTGSLAERLWARPAIAVIGLDAPAVDAASNTLVPAASAKVSLRVPPGDEAATASAALVAHLESHAPWGARVTVAPGAMIAPYAVPTGGRAYLAAHAALAEAWGRPAVDIGVGGSLPFVSAYAELVPGAEILITGVEDPGTRAHGANESLDLTTFARACLAETLLLRNLAETS